MEKEFIGKTIESTEIKKLYGYDDEFLFIRFTDGTVYGVQGREGNFTGQSLNEFPNLISVKKLS